MRKISGAAKKLVYCGFVFAVFLKIFFFSWDIPWHAKYSLFNVPAFTYPGGDARNIQVAAHCSRNGFSFYGANECNGTAKLVKMRFPEATVAPLNYPSYWPKAYSTWGNDSEQFFMWFWRLNALLLVSGLFVFCFHYHYLAFPLFLFSPITLLAIERGNVDAATFFFTFVPLLVFWRFSLMQSFFIGIASALKIFPIFGYLAFVRIRRPFFRAGTLAGALIAAPVAIVSFIELPQIISATGRGFSVAYGLWSLLYAPILEQRKGLAFLAILVFVVVHVAVLWLALRSRRLNRLIDDDLTSLTETDTVVLLISSSIFVLSFFALSNWAYRLVFLIPAFLILSNQRSFLSELICANLLFIFWIPIFPYGWILQNLACFPLAISLSLLLIRGIVCASKFRPKMSDAENVRSPL